MGKSGNSCGVAICKNTSINAKKRGLSLRFFTFPKDPVLKKVWATKCHRQDKGFNPSNAKMCSEHFNEDDFEDALKARLLGTTPVKLKKQAIPSLLLLPSKPCQSRTTTHIQRKERSSMINDIFIKSEPLEKDTSCDAPSTSSHISPTILDPNEKITALEKENSTLKKLLESLQQKLEDSEKEKNELKNKLSLLKRESESNFEIKGKEMLKDCLTDNQVKILMRKKRRVLIGPKRNCFGLH